MIKGYVNNFLLASKHQKLLDWIKECFKNKYNVKDVGKIKTIIGWQVIQNWDAGILKINQSAFIQDVLEEENLTDCNFVNIPIKAGYFIKILEESDYKETNIKADQRL